MLLLFVFGNLLIYTAVTAITLSICSSKKKRNGKKSTNKKNTVQTESGCQDVVKKKKKSKNVTTENTKAVTKKTSKDKKKKGQSKTGNLDYPEVPEPTKSAKKRRQVQLDKSRKRKIAEGFYQSHSDEDDTLEAVKSLASEKTEDISQ